VSRGDPLRVVIVGNGIAGVAVAGKLRELEPDPRHVSVSIFTREPYEYYARIRLPEVFESAMTAADLQTYRPEWYDERHITVHKSREVVAIHRSSKRIALKDGEEVAYDRLVLCTGADSFLPPIPGSHLEWVFTVREYGDAEAIRREVQKGAPVEKTIE
jgi:nitrite reductase (NADH) large subunit